ncbi:MAG: DUF3575 domain-containing protein [Tidjanibacter sp.]|nr:DUF3575 domain-containing protein [Tidjanibacter sp.]
MKVFHKILITLILLTVGTLSLWAQSAPEGERTARFIFYHRFGESIIQVGYAQNGQTIDSLERFVSDVQMRGRAIESVGIVSTASPEGQISYNRSLAAERANNTARFLAERYGFYPSAINAVSDGIGWSVLRDSVAVSGMRHCNELVEMMDTVPEVIVRNGKWVDGLKHRLMNFNGGAPYKYLIRRYFPSMRRSVVTLVLSEPATDAVATNLSDSAVSTVADLVPTAIQDSTAVAEMLPMVSEEPAVEPQSLIVTDSLSTLPDNILPTAPDSLSSSVSAAQTTTTQPSKPDSGSIQSSVAPRERLPYAFGVKTNTLYDLALTPNVAAELAFGRDFGWSAEVEGVWAWWSLDQKHRYWRIGYTSLELRRYLGNRAELRPLSGWYVGMYGAWGRYDFEFGGNGQLSDSAISLGLSAGYSLPVADRLNVEFGLAAGFIGGEYKTYTPDHDCYVWQGTYHRKADNIRNWSVTRLRVALVWTFGEAAR